MDEPVRNTLTGKACLAFAAAVMLGAALAWLVSPTLFRALPTDLTRTRVLLDALGDPQAGAPRIVSFGSSVGMAALDMQTIAAQLPGEPLSWNLSSTGQALAESYLYYQELPDSVSTVIQMVNLRGLKNAEVLNEQKYNAFYMYGYRPDELTVKSMTAVLGDDMAGIFAKSGARQRFESRWAVRQMADRYARGLLRQDLQLDTGTYDLYFPSTYTRRLPDAQFERSIRDKYDYPTPKKLLADPRELAMLEQMLTRAASRGIKVILLFQPLHPAIYEYSSADYLDDVRAEIQAIAARHDALALDAIDVIPGDEYVDALHPSAAGAARLGNWLTAKLVQLHAAGEWLN